MGVLDLLGSLGIGIVYSLFVVGTSSLVGPINTLKQKLVDFRTATAFAIPAFMAVYVTHKFLVAAIPDLVFSLGDLEVTKGMGIMLFFAVITIGASIYQIDSSGGRSGEN